MEIDREFVRYAILIGSAPLWWPFVKALWTDFNKALRQEGGLFGAPPSPRESAAIREEMAKEPETLVSEPRVRPGDVQRRRYRARSSPPR